MAYYGKNQLELRRHQAGYLTRPKQFQTNPHTPVAQIPLTTLPTFQSAQLHIFQLMMFFFANMFHLLKQSAINHNFDPHKLDSEQKARK